MMTGYSTYRYMQGRIHESFLGEGGHKLWWPGGARFWIFGVTMQKVEGIGGLLLCN